MALSSWNDMRNLATRRPVYRVSGFMGNGWLALFKFSELGRELDGRSIQLALFGKTVVKQGVEAFGIGLLAVCLVNLVERVGELLERHVLDFGTGVQREASFVLGSLAASHIDLILGDHKNVSCRLYSLHEEAKDEKGSSAGCPLASRLGFERLGEEIEELLHLTLHQLVYDRLDLSCEYSRGYMVVALYLPREVCTLETIRDLIDKVRLGKKLLDVSFGPFLEPVPLSTLVKFDADVSCSVGPQLNSIPSHVLKLPMVLDLFRLWGEEFGLNGQNCIE
ncbi:hypothetical protein HG530_003614 [Fusarium avenaceum]|nr:hypothetical protein HG530_003614 [Fusarium avenaceum]